MGNSNNQRGQQQPQINQPPRDGGPTIERSQSQSFSNVKNDNPIKKEDPELDPLEQQVQMVFNELMESINELDNDIEAMVKELREQQP